LKPVDWLCAASSALILPGDSCGPLEKPVTGADPAGSDEDVSAGGVEAEPKPVPFEDDGLGVVSDWMAFSAADAAPRASNMKLFRQAAHGGPIQIR